MDKLLKGRKLLILLAITMVLFSPVTSAELVSASPPLLQQPEENGTLRHRMLPKTK